MTTTTTSKITPHDIQHRVSSSKRTNHADVSICATKKKHHAELSHPSITKPDSGSDEVHTAPLINENISINRKHRTRHVLTNGNGQEIPEDADEESNGIRTIINQNKPSLSERYSLNNSANRLQQQEMGDHYHCHSKRNKISSKSHFNSNENNLYHWRIFMYILTIVLVVFVIYRFLLAIWPKPKRTLFKQIIDDLSNVFTL